MTENIHKFKTTPDDQGQRIDKWIKNNLSKIPQSLIEKDLRKGKIKVNKHKVKSSYKLKKNDKIYLYNFSYRNLKTTKKKYIPKVKEIKETEKDIIENNSDFIVINKKAGLPVQGGTKIKENVINILSNSNLFEKSKPYVVHRIDKDTSGILIVAKNRETAQLLTSLFRIRKIHKTYIAIAHGSISKKIKKMEDSLISYENQKKIIQKAISHINIIKKSTDYTLVELNPITGRKHQLRKQLYNIGNPIVGDSKYFINNLYFRKINDKNLMLHAYKIKFMINNIKYNFKAKYSKNFEDFLKNNF